MKAKHRRLWLVAGGMMLLAAASALVLVAFQDNLVFFHSPTDVLAKSVPDGRRFRLGGLVEPGSVDKRDGVVVRFSVTDLETAQPVVFRGILPDLFREGQGVVAEGRLAGGVFEADEVLAKHDETYMPPEVAKALQEKGVKLGKGVTHPTGPVSQ